MRHRGTPVLETPRLVLNHFCEEDAPEMFGNWASDPEVTRWMRWKPHKNVEETRELVRGWVAGYAQPDYYHWAIRRREDRVLMGSLGIFYGDEKGEPFAWDPGYCLGQRFWNHGYASEALAATVNWFVKATGCKELRCCHAVENAASGRVMEKAGFVYHHEGVYTKFDGTLVPARYYVLRAREEEIPQNQQ